MTDLVEYVIVGVQEQATVEAEAHCHFGSSSSSLLGRSWPHAATSATAREHSDLSQQSYRSRFSGEEFFLSDHRVGWVQDRV